MKFVWIKLYEDVAKNEGIDYGWYDLYLMDGKEELVRLRLTDNTTEWRIKNDIKHHNFTDYAFEYDYCSGWSEKGGLGSKNKNSHNEFGFQQEPDITLEEAKKWCENWIAQRFLRSYKQELKELSIKKRMVEWFESQGFKLEEDN